MQLHLQPKDATSHTFGQWRHSSRTRCPFTSAAGNRGENGPAEVFGKRSWSLLKQFHKLMQVCFAFFSLSVTERNKTSQTLLCISTRGAVLLPDTFAHRECLEAVLEISGEHIKGRASFFASIIQLLKTSISTLNRVLHFLGGCLKHFLYLLKLLGIVITTGHTTIGVITFRKRGAHFEEIRIGLRQLCGFVQYERPQFRIQCEAFALERVGLFFRLGQQALQCRQVDS
mmetsp:Transcript_7324/g.10683  ORF Transcript_7324/g.10683 Transcript_7324/m.10683 type:complete len:229 (-) Transcript_7324:351-1037(-)